MGKLFKLQTKGNLKALSWILLIPLVLSAGFILLNRRVDNALTEVGSGISLLLLFLGIGLSALIVMYIDYQRFFGRESIFYQSLPIGPAANIWSRFFSYLVTFLIIFLVMFLDFGIILLASGSISINELDDLFKALTRSLSQISLSDWIKIIIVLLSALISFIYKIIFCINLGTQKAFKSMGVFGPILMFIMLTIILQILFALTVYIMPDIGKYIEEMLNVNSLEISNPLLKLKRAMFYVTIGANILIAAIYAIFSIYLQKNKLSIG
ncbi:MAG: hypothetical protein PUG67_00240 [Peptoniphilaceae bacterium]|nr:hypothetical protein [Peptoniphilaceae bacterium]MDY6018715.1 hypothetical protein [Anaerococcus sp.]